ncbi:Squamous cell carcinoma antigen recognized by T-cells 3 [Cichlidogyrus casuarinus]|uniref:Squamous cell carcinoma antigen recognized by T-cells 3 n=1 Tax=Cichlidogyrus casuarinus TaxID=1844966 RepID=A0ABD2QE50_9PLAT
MSDSEADNSSTSSNSSSEHTNTPLSTFSKEEVQKLLENVKHNLLVNPSSYDDLVQLIKLLSHLKDKEALSVARNSMHKIYPLTPELWKEWIADEISEASDVLTKKKVEKYFILALEDYQSIEIWLEYCQFAISIVDLADAESLAYSRNIFDRALLSFGSHFTEGFLLFDVFREFEKLVLTTYGEDIEPEKLIILDNIYRRQLKIPSQNINSVYEEYKNFLEALPDYTGIPPNVTSDYENSLVKTKLLEPFEDKLLIDDDTSLVWLDYLEFLIRNRIGTKSGHSKNVCHLFSPSEIKTAFERAISDTCIQSEIWLKFFSYLEQHLQAELGFIVQTYRRAIRNVPWHADIWLGYLLALEQEIQINLPPPSSANGSSSHETDRFPPHCQLSIYKPLTSKLHTYLRVTL